MSRESIFQIAREMLESTNVFDKGVDEIRYSSHRNDCEEIRFLDLVRKCTQRYNHRYRGWSEDNILRAYNSIVGGMIEYIEDYPATFSFKQRTKYNFKRWLLAIQKHYQIAKQEVPDELNPNNESDTGIALLKLLHDRDGVSYDDIHEELDIDLRAIQKDLVKLCPSMYTGNGKPYSPFRIGGQKLQAKIELVANTPRAKEKRFFTRNTIHPLILQENVMQLATMLRALARQYYDGEDDIARLIAVDVWSQMSDYARKKMISHFTHNDTTLKDFIDEISDPTPNDHACRYRSEKEMVSEIEMTAAQAIEYLEKADMRTATIIFQDGSEQSVVQVEFDQDCGDRAIYVGFDEQGHTTKFTLEQVKTVIIRRTN